MAERRLTREEQETIIRISAAETEWHFFNQDKKFIRRVERLGYKLAKDPQGGFSCRIPLKRISIRRPEKRKLSEKQRQNLRRFHPSFKSSTAIEEILTQPGRPLGREGDSFDEQNHAGRAQEYWNPGSQRERADPVKTN